MAQLNTSSAEACTQVYMARARDLFSDIRFTIASGSYSEHTSLRRLESELPATVEALAAGAYEGYRALAVRNLPEFSGRINPGSQKFFDVWTKWYDNLGRIEPRAERQCAFFFATVHVAPCLIMPHCSSRRPHLFRLGFSPL